MAYLELITNVFNEWAAALAETSIGNRVYMERPNEDIKFPCASMMPLPSNETGYDLDNAASGIDLTVQTEVLVRSGEKLSTAYALNEASHEAMCNMGFRRTTPTLEMPMNGYKRLISRYSRVVGYGEPISTED